MLEFEIFDKGKSSAAYEDTIDVYECFGTLESDNPEKRDPACMCKISVTKDKWTISSWYTKRAYKKQGIGKQTLGHLLKFLHQTYGIPKCIEYIWDGRNEYVGDWMTKHFDAKCKCPIAVQKMLEAEDDWSSHIYRLNVAKVFEYFEIDNETIKENENE